MNKVKLKICGLTQERDVVLCLEMGIDILGFVVDYPLSVPWNLTADEAQTLIKMVRAPAKSCVVTGGEKKKIIALSRRLRPDYVQLHFRETLEEAAFIADALQPQGIGIIKTLPFSSHERLAQFGTADIIKCTELLNASGVFAILADSREPSNASERGTPADIGLYRLIKSRAEKPVILAGGVTPVNIGRLVDELQPEIIDVLTGVESSPGVKDAEKMRRLLRNSRRYK